jgi:hypothetical protein
VGRIKDIFSVLHVNKKKGHTNTLASCPIEAKTKNIEINAGSFVRNNILFRVMSLGNFGLSHLILERQASGQYSGTCRDYNTTQT